VDDRDERSGAHDLNLGALEHRLEQPQHVGLPQREVQRL
jgi:hypothetical protein